MLTRLFNTPKKLKMFWLFKKIYNTLYKPNNCMSIYITSIEIKFNHFIADLAVVVSTDDHMQIFHCTMFNF